ncbi:hypothetical protein [Saccharopolyspora cebuensis]|uniref:Uncharacterized protein n=1 Tax=Saccharopolyspora cebuensis TaxID=418759 RepID=A0ABV4CKV4_9PSEU
MAGGGSRRRYLGLATVYTAAAVLFPLAALWQADPVMAAVWFLLWGSIGWMWWRRYARAR